MPSRINRLRERKKRRNKKEEEKECCVANREHDQHALTLMETSPSIMARDAKLNVTVWDCRSILWTLVSHEGSLHEGADMRK
jgi:hypothetical protein